MKPRYCFVYGKRKDTIQAFRMNVRDINPYQTLHKVRAFMVKYLHKVRAKIRSFLNRIKEVPFNF